MEEINPSKSLLDYCATKYTRCSTVWDVINMITDYGHPVKYGDFDDADDAEKVEEYYKKDDVVAKLKALEKSLPFVFCYVATDKGRAGASMYQAPEYWYTHKEAVKSFFEFMPNQQWQKKLYKWCVKQIEEKLQDQEAKEETLEMLQEIAEEIGLEIEKANLPEMPKINWLLTKNELHFLLKALHKAKMIQGEVPQWSIWEKLSLIENSDCKGLRKKPDGANNKEEHFKEMVNTLKEGLAIMRD